jgi:exonuclease SbcC
MVSLSLALALSSMGREGISMDTLFIDEGFGTLSTENQVRVMDLLQTLQRTQGKRVGIISHVPYLLERIPIQIQVSRLRDDNTKSSVRVLTTTT